MKYIYFGIIWWGFSGMIGEFFIICGLLAIIISHLFDRFFYHHIDYEDCNLYDKQNNFDIISLLIYLLWLIKEMVVSSILLCYSILTFDNKVNSYFILYKTKLIDDFKKSVLFHSITFTPGTITINCDEELHIEVHSLATSNLEGIKKIEKYLINAF